MYAIVDITGQQYKVEKDMTLYVHRLNGEIGSVVEFDKVMLSENNGKFTIGMPNIDGAKVTATILDHLKDKKVIVFKKKRRKGYRVKRGHRQQMTKIQITDIKN